MKWKHIDTCPQGETVDIYVRSVNRPDYGRRVCSVWIVDGDWHGCNLPQSEYGEYASHWMPLPKEPPKWK